MGRFYLEDLLNEPWDHGVSHIDGMEEKYSNETVFDNLCREIKNRFIDEWKHSKEEMDTIMRIQKKAIIGHENEVAYFKEKIKEMISELGVSDVYYPTWYQSLEDGIYHENWGLAGLAEWFSPAFKESSSAKVIGDRIYFMESGRMALKPQQMTKDRREQLLRAFLLFTPEERMDKDFHELYMLDGTRVTVFRGQMTKKNQDVFVFRRYIIPVYNFEAQCERGTIPEEAIPLFESMVGLGYNVAFTGAVRSAKTTFLSTWQSYEQPELEGVMVETDPEIPLHRIMPDSPNIQLIADNERLRDITKNLLRSDADYFIMAEARDGFALDTVVRIASKGTRRLKITFHERDPYEFPYDVAAEIIKSVGGDMTHTANRVASSFDYIFHFVQLKRKNQKRLSGIYEISFDRESQQIEINRICRYDFENDCWSWEYRISLGKESAGKEENPDLFRLFSAALKALSEKQPEMKSDAQHFNDSYRICSLPDACVGSVNTLI